MKETFSNNDEAMARIVELHKKNIKPTKYIVVRY